MGEYNIIVHRAAEETLPPLVVVTGGFDWCFSKKLLLTLTRINATVTIVHNRFTAEY
jgi:hypothetical protein